MLGISWDKAIKAAQFIKAAQLLQLSLVLRGFLSTVIFSATGEASSALCISVVLEETTPMKVISKGSGGGFSHKYNVQLQEV